MNLPKEFIEYTRQLMGEELYATFEKGMQEEPPVSIRLNPFKTDANNMNIPLKEKNIEWCEYGMYLTKRPNFTFDPLLHAGLYYVQEASSMFVYHVLKQVVKNPVLMLDLCAAPGGKTTCAMSALPKGSKMFSNEPIRQRSQILNENIQKFGVSDICVTNNYAKDYQKSKLLFDVILTDVPCSGEGMFRKDEGAINEWSVKNVEECQRLQREIVSDIWDSLKPGGILIYSTCTFNAHEDEENVAWIAENLGADFIRIDTKKEWNITGSLIDDNPVYRFIPGKTRGEGIFMAVLRKYGNYDGKMSNSNIDSKALKALHILYNGVKADTIKGKQSIPDHSKAMSTTINKDEYPNVEINYNQAIAYLRKEAITLDYETPKGIVLLTYKKQPIGFAKNIGNRANNLYPQEWRIKSSHIPEENTTIIE
jgi:16S rRNA C967 or C1407 C5-methylase (RsmB/RsmF family)/NOL1/NOP2/fmu family ribosome biogenesis protein